VTLEAWVYPTVTLSGEPTVVLKETPGSTVYALYASGGANKPNAWIQNNGSLVNVEGGTKPARNVWTHLAMTYDAATAVFKLYVNGVLRDTHDIGTNRPIDVSTGALRFGGNAVWSGEWFRGRIDNVRIYSRALTVSEISTNMNTPVEEGGTGTGGAGGAGTGGDGGAGGTGGSTSGTSGTGGSTGGVSGTGGDGAGGMGGVGGDVGTGGTVGTGGAAGDGTGGTVGTGGAAGDGAAGTGGAAGDGSGGTGGAAGTGGSGTGVGGTGNLRQPPLVEYPIDEAASGQVPTFIHDAQPSPLDSNIVYVGTTPQFAENAGMRSLYFPAGNVKFAGAFSASLDVGNKVFDALNGAQKASIEVVAEVDWQNNPAVDPYHVFGIAQEDGENDDFMLWKMQDCLIASYTGAGGYPADYHLAAVPISAVTAGVHIFHVVLDTTAAVQADRLSIYVDGARPAPAQFPPGLGQQPISLNATMGIPRPNMSWGFTGPNHYQQLALGGFTNYAFGTGGFRGKIYYAAVHRDALNSAEIASAPTRLLSLP
jgi:hypothetical protein